MIGFILTIIIGFGIAYLSSTSISSISITLGNYTYSNIPLTAITLSTYLIGMVLAWIIEVPQTIATALKIIGFGRTIKSGDNTIIQLQSKIQKLEIENSKLQGQYQSRIANRATEENVSSNSLRNFFRKRQSS